MKILLLGKSGQVGWELQRSLAPLGDVLALGSKDTQTHFYGNLNDLDALQATIETVSPQVIVNAAAYTSVDKAESDATQANHLNAVAPGALARSAAQCNALLVHYSTDYVFNGSEDSPWKETDSTAPLNVYGQTKLQGEHNIIASGCRCLIFRTSWVYASRGNNFAKTMLRLGQEKEELKIIDDQYGAPTGADLIADITAHALSQTLRNPSLEGLYHLTAAGETTWYHYACFVLEFARKNGVLLTVPRDAIHAVSSSTFVTAAQRPMNSRLNCQKLVHAFNLALPQWEKGVARMLTEILEQK